MVVGRYYVRRAASVPADDFRSPILDSSVLNKAHQISSHAVQDADAITAKSRRHDQDFMNQVSNRMAMANNPTYHLREGTPVYIGSRYPAPPTHATIGDYRRRSYVPPVSDYEVAAYLAGGPRPYVRSSRGTSVPPSAPRWYPPTVTKGVPRWSYSQPYSRASLAPHEDVVVGVAHTSLYGDIVIGIPYNKRHMFDSEVDNNYGNNLRRYSYSPAKVSSRYTPAPSAYPTRVVSPVTSNYRRASVAVPYRSIYDDYDDVITPPPRYRGSVVPRRHDPDLDADWPTRPRETVTSLRGRAHSVQRQLEGIPEFSVYTPGKTRAASVAPTYVSHSANPGVGSTYSGYSGGSPPTYSAGSAGGYTGGASAASSRPPVQPSIRKRQPVSDARRKVRDVLCRSKNNPHYYDD